MNIPSLDRLSFMHPWVLLLLLALPLVAMLEGGKGAAPAQTCETRGGAVADGLGGDRGV